MAVLALLAGCPGGDDVADDAATDAPTDTPSPDGPESCPIGDPSQPMEIVPVASNLSGAIDLTEGAMVGLVRPIQGGKVIFVGVRARNIDPCREYLTLTAALEVPGSGQVVALEQRPVRLEPESDGWGHPYTEFYDLANLPACPNAATQVDIDQASWLIELRLETPAGRNATVTRTVMPRCLRPEEQVECECECDSDYTVGGACPVDP